MSRELILGIVIGLIVGWIIEWIIDWFYWRKKYETLKIQMEMPKDNLQKIKGIGPEIEKRLNEAGIYSFKQLSQLSQQEVEDIIGKVQNLADEKELISEAKKRAKKKDKKSKKA